MYPYSHTILITDKYKNWLLKPQTTYHGRFKLIETSKHLRKVILLPWGLMQLWDAIEIIDNNLNVNTVRDGGGTEDRGLDQNAGVERELGSVSSK